jgi:hypothetical protein
MRVICFSQLSEQFASFGGDKTCPYMAEAKNRQTRAQTRSLHRCKRNCTGYVHTGSTCGNRWRTEGKYDEHWGDVSGEGAQTGTACNGDLGYWLQKGRFSVYDIIITTSRGPKTFLSAGDVRRRYTKGTASLVLMGLCCKQEGSRLVYTNACQ